MSDPNWGYDALDSMTLGTCVYCGEKSDKLDPFDWCPDCIKQAHLENEEERAMLEQNEYYEELANPAPVICPECGQPTPVESFNVEMQMCARCFGEHEAHDK